LSISLEVCFIAGQEDQHIFRALALYFLEPVHCILERLVGINRVAQYDCVCVSVKDFGDRPEVFFACSVPNLELQQFALDPYCVRVKLNADCDLAFDEFIFN
jgi:hypothetical protein